MLEQVRSGKTLAEWEQALARTAMKVERIRRHLLSVPSGSLERDMLVVELLEIVNQGDSNED